MRLHAPREAVPDLHVALLGKSHPVVKPSYCGFGVLIFPLSTTARADDDDRLDKPPSFIKRKHLRA